MKLLIRFGRTHMLRRKMLLMLFVGISLTIDAQETLSNNSIMQMVELGFDDQTIITKINSSDFTFDTSIAGLSALKKGGVSPAVIDLIIQKAKVSNKKKTGIYFGNGKKQVRIQPTVFAGKKSDRTLQSLSRFINSKIKAILPGRVSNNVVVTKSPEFTFIFDKDSSDRDFLQTADKQDGDDNWFFKTASSPNEFVLIKVKVRKKQNIREVVIGKSNSLANSSGIDLKGSIPFRIEEVKSNIYKVTVSNLEAGEYAFLYQGNVPQGRNNQIVFDFSIQ